MTEAKFPQRPAPGDGSEKPRFAVVGCGKIGSRHCAVVDAEERAELVAVCDIDENVGRRTSELYGGIPAFTDFSTMLRKTDATIVNICTPHGLHAPMAIEAAKAGKHILVEKPMALTVKDCRAMIDVAKKNGVKLMVVKQNRYNVPIALAKNALDSKRLGKVLMAQCNVLWNRHKEYYEDSAWRGKRALEGGALYTQASHFIDLMIWWFGDVVRAETTIETRLHEIEIEDCGAALLQFSSGVLGTLLWTTCVYNKNYEGSITIIGEHGTIKVGGQYLNKIEYWDVQSYPLPDNVEFVDKPNTYGKYEGTSSNHDKVINDVVAELLNERHNVVEGDEGIKTIEAIEKIYAGCGAPSSR
ncbi:MAG TPA: Gfo/Idh/MocA family oxidoreductase [Bacteroidota bacterium]|nr:Gfo/Idh/MocA family oxidoreductase [Bacteroidota bacterium]